MNYFLSTFWVNGKTKEVFPSQNVHEVCNPNAGLVLKIIPAGRESFASSRFADEFIH